ncbi:protein JTB [Engystomops pustulosus]|uniref:protein JTB n=1 Tax=Engystomops pustulosus TaxID=76066 RepID=UPI003AFA1D75
MMEVVGWRMRAVILLCAHCVMLSSASQDQMLVGDPDPPAMSTPCWQTEEYTTSKDCYSCTQFESKTLSQCTVTGFIEQVTCTSSSKSEYKSCRSTPMEKRVFWQFVGAMLGGSVLLSLLVISRQRMLDRRALEKVRKQIESI